MNDPIEEKLQELRVEWKRNPKKRPIIERIARTLKQQQAKYSPLKRDVLATL